MGITSCCLLLGPGAVADNIDEIITLEPREEVLQNISFDIAEGGFRTVFETMGEGRKDLVFKVRTRVCLNDCLTLLRGERVVSDAQYIEFYTASY